MVINKIQPNREWCFGGFTWSVAEVERLLSTIGPPIKTWVYSNPKLLRMAICSDGNLFEEALYHFGSREPWSKNYKLFYRSVGRISCANMKKLLSNTEFIKALIEDNPYILCNANLRETMKSSLDALYAFGASISECSTVQEFKEYAESKRFASEFPCFETHNDRISYLPNYYLGHGYDDSDDD
jgi:hypothetical protein